LLELICEQYPESVGKAKLAEYAGMSPDGGGYNNYLGHMRTLGFIDYPQKGVVKAESWLFVE
jgi:hypothetical protein